MRFNMSFDEFREEYIKNLEGYLPTYFSADEEHKSELMRIDVEMIAPLRMTDGPSRFFRVITIDVTKEQYEELKDYAVKAGERWTNDLIDGVKKCSEYSQTNF